MQNIILGHLEDKVLDDKTQNHTQILSSYTKLEIYVTKFNSCVCVILNIDG